MVNFVLFIDKLIFLQTSSFNLPNWKFIIVIQILFFNNKFTFLKKIEKKNICKNQLYKYNWLKYSNVILLTCKFFYFYVFLYHPVCVCFKKNFMALFKRFNIAKTQWAIRSIKQQRNGSFSWFKIVEYLLSFDWFEKNCLTKNWFNLVTDVME